MTSGLSTAKMSPIRTRRPHRLPDSTPTPAPANEDPEENDEPKDPKPEEEDPKPEDKPKAQNKGSQAPKRETGKVPVNKSNVAKEAYELFQQYGPGAWGQSNPVSKT